MSEKRILSNRERVHKELFHTKQNLQIAKRKRVSDVAVFLRGVTTWIIIYMKRIKSLHTSMI